MATTKSARSQPDIGKQGAKEPATQTGARIHPLRGELPLSERYEAGKALRTELPLKAHADWSRDPAHPGPVELVMRGNEGRQPQLVPLRLARMIASPFALFRGADSVMAHDLGSTPSTGIQAVLDGDAHLNNFGLYGTPQRDVVFDLNDFDETIIGPWEWDLKRLTASVNLAARENGMNRRERDAAVRRCVVGYRSNMRRLHSMGVLETWYLHAYPGRENPLGKMDAKSQAVSRKLLAKAATQTNAMLLRKVAGKLADGHWRFRENPPVLTRVDSSTRRSVEEALEAYASTLPREREFMLKKYRIADVAHRVVGLGSVGTRAYLVLLFGNGDSDPLFLQVKEATEPVHRPFLSAALEEFSHHGKRVVTGQAALQASTDVMLGWTQIGRRPFYVRQMKNMKSSIPVEWLTGTAFNFYSWACGAVLARAHARTTDAAIIAGYCGKSAALDDALAIWAEAYADQTVLDHAALVKALKNDKKVQALTKS
jgi:uncharacterized protein (DUF2252 family)